MNNIEPKPITVTFPSGEVASKVVNFLVKKRPSGWGRHSYATYYKETYAKWLQKDIDIMIATKQKLVYRYSYWPKIRENALYQRVMQARMYIIDNMDESGIYAKWREETSLKRVPGLGITIEYDEILDGEHSAEFVAPNLDKPKWMERMDEYLESREPNMPPFHQEGLLLTVSEIAELKEMLSELSEILFEVTSKEVKIVKL